MSTARACKYPDPDLRLCIEFDDSVFMPKAHDASTYQNDADTVHVGTATRGNAPAAALFADTTVHVPERPMLDISKDMTIELWAYDPFPAFDRFIDNATQYSITTDGEGHVICRMGMASVTSQNALSANAWHHIACGKDSTGLALFIDGNGSNCQSSTSPTPTGGMMGTTIGAYLGVIDDIRIYARALTDAEICTHADRTGGCAPACSDGVTGDGGGTGFGGGGFGGGFGH